MNVPKNFGDKLSKVSLDQRLIGLIVLIIAGFVGNYCRWTLFFDIDFIFGSIAVWIVVCLYGVKWGTLAGFVAGYCTYLIWNHPYTAITFTTEALFVGWLFHHRQQNNIVLLDGLFWLVLGMPLVWLFYAVILKVAPTQALIILMKQPVNGIFNALIASLILTHTPIHRWVKRPAAISTLSLEQTLFNLLVAFVSVPTLILIVLASHQVVHDIQSTVQVNLNDASRYLKVEVQRWYERRIDAIDGLAELVSLQSNLIQQNAAFLSSSFPDFRHIHILDTSGAKILELDRNVNDPNSAFDERKYFEQLRQDSQPFISPVILSENPNLPVALLGVPILRDRQLVGAIFCEIDLSLLSKFLRTSIGEELLQVIIVDQQQTVAASTKKEWVGNPEFNWRKDGKVNQISLDTYQWLPTKSRLIMVQWQTSLFVKESVINKNIPWQLVVQISATPQANQIQQVHSRNMALLLLISGLALILATVVSRRLVKPLNQLADITTNLPNKLLEQEPIYWLRSSITELSILVKNFRSMAFSLKQKFREISLANELLEKRVQERTQALRSANTELELELEVRERQQAQKALDLLNAELENRVVRRTAQLEAANKELESFSYSVSHDLRAPLRAIDGFSRILEEDYGDRLDEEGKRYLKVVRDNAKRMGELIDDLLNLSRLNRRQVARRSLSVNKLIEQILDDSDFQKAISKQQIELVVADLPDCEADLSLLTQVWINLISNAIKYTGKTENAKIEIGYQIIGDQGTYFIRDNGAGFDMQYADKLFGVFQRMHREHEFEGTGIGLAIVQRIIQRHGGTIWANAAVDQGATFYFTIPTSE